MFKKGFLLIVTVLVSIIVIGMKDTGSFGVLAQENGTSNTRFLDIKGEYQEGQVLIKYQEPDTGLLSFFSNKKSLSEKLDDIGVSDFRAIGKENKSSGFFSSLSSNAEEVWYHAELDEEVSVKDALVKLGSVEGVVFAEPNYIYRLSVEGTYEEVDLTDPLYQEQYYLNTLRMDEARTHLESLGINPGGRRDVVVAVIDTGVDYTHPDLAGNMWINTSETRNNYDSDGNGYQDDIYGVNVVSDDRFHSGDPMDDHGHGTHVAGIIAAKGDNGVGIKGIADNVKIMSIKAGSSSGVFLASDIAEGILYAYEKGADVINMSFGGYAPSNTVEDALSLAFSTAVLVAAAGNDGQINKPHIEGQNMYPAAYPWVIGVMASDGQNLTGFSNFDYKPEDSSEYSVVAPGAQIMSTLPGGKYAKWSGTSMSAPMVSGMAALLRSKFDEPMSHSSRFIMGQIIGTANPNIPVPKVYKDKYGVKWDTYSQIDVFNALTEVPKPNLSFYDYYIFDTAGLSSNNNADGIIDNGESIDLALMIRNHWGRAGDVNVTIDTLSPAGISDPYVTIETGTVNYGAVGTFSTDDNGFIYTDEDRIIGVENPFKITLSDDTPNDHVIRFNVTIAGNNGLDVLDETIYKTEGSFTLTVRNGFNLPNLITEDMTLTNDKYYIIENATRIEEGVTVTVEPGTKIQFWSSNPEDVYAEKPMVYLQVDGTLQLNGSEEEPIELFPSELMGSHEVKLYTNGTGKINMAYTRVINPRINVTAIDHSYFTQNFDYITQRYLSDGKVLDSISTEPHVYANIIENSIFWKLTGAYSYYEFKVAGILNNNLFDSNNLSLDQQIWTEQGYYNLSDATNNVFLNNFVYKEYQWGGREYYVSKGTQIGNAYYSDPTIQVNQMMRNEETGTSYVIVSGTGLNYSIERFARYLGGQLAIIESKEENDFINQHSSYNTTIGLKRNHFDNTYNWINESEFAYENWNSNVNLNYSGNYASIETNGNWNTVEYSHYLIELTGDIYVNDILLKSSDLTLGSDGQPYQTEYDLIPYTASHTDLVWTSLDETIATVSSTGVITPVSIGETQIIVKSNDDYVIKTIILKVVQTVPLEQIKLSGVAQLEINQLYKMPYTLNPSNSTEKAISWTSSDETVATVDGFGNVMGHAPGAVTIKAQNPDGTIFDEHTLQIVVPVQSISFDDDFKAINLSDVASPMPINVYPENATNKNITWETSNDNIAYVDEYGLLQSVGVGTAVIRATAEHTDFNDEIIISVSEDTSINAKIIDIDSRGGDSSTVYALTDDGSMWYWGNNTVLLPKKVNISNVIKIAVGYNYVLALKSDGTVYRISEQSVSQISTLTNVVDIATMYEHSLALKSDGTVWGWGSNYYGQIADISTTSVNSPIQIDGIQNVKAISALSNTSIFLTNEGNVYYRGTENKVNEIKQSTGLTNVVSIKVSSDYAYYSTQRLIARDVNNEFYYATYNSSPSIQRVEHAEVNGSIVDVAYNDSHTLILNSFGDVYSKGNNNHGQLGNGTTTNNYQFTNIGLSSISKVLVSQYNSFAISESGELYIWGNNESKQITDLTNTARLTPYKVMFGIIPDAEKPKLESSLPINNAQAVSINSEIILDFDEALRISSEYIYFRLKDSQGNVISTQRELKLDKMYIRPLEELKYGETYTINVPSNAVMDMFTNSNDAFNVTFKTEDFINLSRTNYNIDINEIPVQIDYEINTKYINGITFTSLNELVATVSSDGIITPISLGTTSIIVSSNDGKYSHIIDVKIIELIPITSIDILSEALVIGSTQTERIMIEVNPVNCNEDLIWLSSDSSIAKVDEYGFVTGLMNGTVTITAQNKLGSIMDSITVTVIEPVSSVEFNEDFVSINLIDAAVPLPVNVYPETATNKTIIWETSNESVAYVDEYGLLQAVGIGTAVIRATAQHTDLYDEIIISVSEKSIADLSIIDSAIISYDGKTSVFAVMDDGSLWTWGKGMLGRGSASDSSIIPYKLDITNVISIESSSDRKLSILKDDGTVWGIGTDYYPSGNGNYSSYYFTQASNLSNVNKVSVASSHTVALKDDGTVWTWGYNGYGQLGDGSTTERSKPIQVNQLTDIIDIASSYHSSYFLNADGELYYVGGSNNQLTPKQITGIDQIKFIKKYNNGNITVITETNEVFRIDYNQNIYNLNVMIPENTNIVDFTGSDTFQMLLLDNGQAYTFGNNSKGQLGNGKDFEYYDSSNMTTVDLSQVNHISVGYQNGMAVTEDGKLHIWGANESGQLADLSKSDSNKPLEVRFGIVSDTNPSTITTVSPGVNADTASVTSEIRVTFNEAVLADQDFVFVNILDSNGNTVSSMKELRLNELIIKPVNPLNYGEVYTISIPSNAVIDMFENKFPAYSYQFTTEPQTSIQVVEEDSSTSLRHYWTNQEITEQFNQFVEEGHFSAFNNNAILNNILDPNVENWMRFFANDGDGTYYFTNNYWGTSDEFLVNKHVVDFYDYQSLQEFKVGPYLLEGNEEMYPFITDVTLHTATEANVARVGAEDVTVRVEFNRDMNMAVPLSVFFGPDYPYTDYRVLGDWVDARTWEGLAKITPLTGDGKQYFRIRDGVAADDGWLKIGDDDGRFMFEIISMGTESMNLQATGSEGRIHLSWMQDEFDTIAGYNIYRSTSRDGTYSRINTSLVSADVNEYNDYDVEPGIMYYYKFTISKTGLKEGESTESDFSNVASASAYDTIAPELWHSPIKQSNVEQEIFIYATATDNIGVTSVKLYYRAFGSEVYNSVDMIKGVTSRYTGKISVLHVQVPGIEYYIEVSDGLSTATSGTATAPYKISIIDQPTIETISPTSGYYTGGTLVTITGTNFKVGATVFFSDKEGFEATVVDQNTITVKSPAQFPSMVNIKVMNPSGDYDTMYNAFEYFSEDTRVMIPHIKAGIGHEIIVPVKIDNVYGMIASDLEISYDDSMLTFVEVLKGNITNRFNMTTNSSTLGKILISMASSTTISGGGDLLYLKFTVKESTLTTSAITIDNLNINSDSVGVTIENGSVEIASVYQFSGTVYYYSNSQVVNMVEIALVGDEEYLTMTDSNGLYKLQEIVPGDYVLSAYKDDELEAISAYDAALILRAAVKLDQLTTYQIVAADVNNDGKVNSMDAALVLQYVAGLIELPFQGTTSTWKFIYNQEQFTGLSSDIINQDMIAILIGDVSGNNYQSGDYSVNQETNFGVVNVGKFEENLGNYHVPIHFSHINYDLYSFEITIKINDGVTIDDIILSEELSNCFYVINSTKSNEIRIVVASSVPISTRDNAFNIKFNVDETLLDKAYFTIENTRLNEFTKIVEIDNVLNFNLNMDLNSDGTIDEDDMVMFIHNYNQTNKHTDISNFDVNSDGIIDLYDIIAAKKQKN